MSSRRRSHFDATSNKRSEVSRGTSDGQDIFDATGERMYLSKQEALQEIGLAIAPAFPADARFTAADELTAISVKLDTGRIITVRFSRSVLRKYANANPSSRQRAKLVIRSLCERHLLDDPGKRSGQRVIEAETGLEKALNRSILTAQVAGG